MGTETGTENGAPAAVLYALLVGSAILSGIGDILVFRWAKGRDPWMLVGGSALWVVSLVLMGYLFRYSSLPFSLVVVLLIVIHLLIDVAWDVAALGGRFSAWQWVGVALAVGAVVLLQYRSEHE